MTAIGQKFGIFTLGLVLGGAIVGGLWALDEARNPTATPHATQADSSSSETAPQPSKEATSFESKAVERLKASFKTCGSSSFARASSLGTVYEISGLKILVEEIQQAEADRLSGVVWLGSVDIQGLFRSRCLDRCDAGPDWTEWTETLGIFLDDNTVALKADGWHTSLPFDKPDDAWTCERYSLAKVKEESRQ